MQGNVKILYGGNDVFSGICPTPFLYFDKEYIEYGSNWGSKYNFSIEGQITGKIGPAAFYDLENKKNQLILNFKKDNLPIKITEDSSGIFLSDICSIDSISFDQSKYYALLPFSIKASCYDSGTFGENYGVLEPQDSWDYSESVFLTTWYEDLTPLDSNTAFNHEFWQTVMTVRAEVSQALEHSRTTKEIGSSLAANVELECDENTFATLDKLGDELRFVFITSDAKISKLDTTDYQVKIKVTASTQQKCVRCWHQRADVGSHSEHPELCGRCVENIAGEGEIRLYA